MGKLPRLVVVLGALALAACATAAPPEPDDESAMAEVFERVKASPPELVAFLRAMPKGGDLHSHLSGAVYAESYIAWAAEDGLCVDTTTYVILAPPCDDTAGRPAMAAAVANEAFYFRLVDALSMRNIEVYPLAGHHQFFATFAMFNAAGDGREGDMLAEVMTRAADQNILYLELMTSPGMSGARKMAAGLPWNGVEGLPALRQALPAGELDALVDQAVARVDAMEADARALLDCDGAHPPACDVTVRYLAQVIRIFPPQQVFAQTVLGFRLVEQDPRFVGINFVAPEDDPVTLRDYTAQMEMVAFAAREMPEVPIALHAGELTIGLVPPEDLRFHIREAVEIAGADRIGHGVDLMYEDDPYGLLALMAERGVAVEINLTSNDVILGVAGDRHPFPIYRAHGVPTVLSTDDEGVSRIDLTHEYARAVETWGLTYADVKTLSYNSLRYAFADEREALLAELDARFDAFEAEVLAAGR